MLKYSTIVCSKFLVKGQKWMRDALVAQLAEHILGKDEVGGSSPLEGSRNQI